ncbi:MAG: glycosyltransferase [Candidatus Nanopelagicales bacterium]|nr:glycosyltransferase [Candidatus Nanopelagicales bacterium]MDZ4250177.1 glycosyltransferase [Candidatus Nanopelagicales bacterium]
MHLVENSVVVDSRVLKCAQVSHSQGFPTVILGVGQGRDAITYDGIPVLRVPVLTRFRDVAAAADRARRLRADTLDEWFASQESAVLSPDPATQRRWFGLRPRSSQPAARVTPPPAAQSDVISPWWVRLPHVVDHELAWNSVLRVLRPDFIHAHDVLPLPIAAHYAAARRNLGERVWVLYDAHEWLAGKAADSPGTTANTPSAWESFYEIERIYIASADAVITVSERMADLIAADHSLGARPRVVLNAPPRSPDPVPSLRDVIKVPEAPLMVYSGATVANRAIDTVVDALPGLPGVHLALVVGARSQTLVGVLARARELRVENRIHLAGYVRPQDVVEYLRSADVGLIPRKSLTSLDMSLPTKLREYLVAGLPIVASDNREMADFIARTGVGEVFPSEDVAGFVAAVREVLADPAGYRSGITQQLKAELEWDTQVPVLRGVYSEMLSAAQADEGAGEALPHPGVAGQVVPPELSEVSEQVPDIAKLRRAGVHVAIGSDNHAGQAFAWAEAVTRNLGVPVTTFGRRAPVPSRLPHSFRIFSGRGIGQRAGFLLDVPSHVLVNGFQPLFGPLFGADLRAELPRLQELGFRVALAAHSNEIRDPKRHMDRIEFSYFRDAPADTVAELTGVSGRNRSLAAEVDLPVFVSTPDLLLDLPTACWLPLTINVRSWKAQEPALHRDVPVVVHLPSVSTPQIEGTAVIDQVLRNLARLGRIEYRRPKVESQRGVRKLVANADIVVDQIFSGSYGVPAIRAMAAGRLVVGYVADDVRSLMPEPPPIVDATASRFATAMERILSDRENFRGLAASGPTFASKWHDGRAAATALDPFVSLPALR